MTTETTDSVKAEPRGCPTPGACSCVAPAFQTDKDAAVNLAHALGLSAEQFTSGAADILVASLAAHRLRATDDLLDALEEIELLATNHGGWFENDAWGWGQSMGSLARAAIARHRGTV